MSEEIEISDIVKHTLEFCKDTNSYTHDSVIFIKKKFGDLLLNELKNCRSVKLNSKRLDFCSLKDVLDAIISWGDYNALSAPLKALIISLWSYLKRRVYRKRKSLLSSSFSVNDVYDLELFCSCVMKNSISCSWTRSLQEIFLHSVQHPSRYWISTSHKMQELLEVLTRAAGNEKELSLLTTMVSPDVINATYPLLNGITLLHYVSLISDNLMQNNNLIRLLTASSSSIDLNAVDYSGQTPLHYACLSLNYAFIMNLSSMRGINKSMKDLKGRTPLQTFLETLAKSARSRFLMSVERTSTIIKELLPNNDPLSLWELWSSWSIPIYSSSSSCFTVLNRRTCYQSCPVYFIFSYCNVAVAYEMLNLSLPSVSCNSAIILILTELFIVVIKKKKNSLLSKLLSFLSCNCDSYWKRNEFRWSLNNLLMTVSAISNNLDSLTFCYENLLLSCEINSVVLLDIQQSSLKRSQYLGFLYILIMKEPNDWVISGKATVGSSEPRNNSYALLNNVVDSIIKQLSILLGQHLYLLINPVFNRSNENWKAQLEQMLTNPFTSQSFPNPEVDFSVMEKAHDSAVNILFPVFYSVILTAFPFEDHVNITKNQNSSSWNKFLAVVERMNFITLSSFVGNSVVLDSLIKRVFFISKQSSSTTVDDEFSVKMKNEYCQSIQNSIYFHQVKTVESLRNTVGFSEMGRMVFSAGIARLFPFPSVSFSVFSFSFPDENVSCFETLCLYLRKLVQSQYILAKEKEKINAVSTFVDPEYLFLIQQFLHSFPKKLLTDHGKTNEILLNSLRLKERIQGIDTILYEKIGKKFIANYQFSAATSATSSDQSTSFRIEKRVEDQAGAVHQLKSFLDMGNIMKSIIATSAVTNVLIKEFQQSSIRWEMLIKNIYSSKFKIGLK
jgi:hypothetical protein